MRKSLLVLIYLIIIGIVIVLEVIAFVMTVIDVLGANDVWGALSGLILYGLQVGE